MSLPLRRAPASAAACLPLASQELVLLAIAALVGELRTNGEGAALDSLSAARTVAYRSMAAAAERERATR